jgi:putative SOS response-associated peptidase YedK
VPFTSFSEYDTIDGKKVPVWFAFDESRPLLAFAGLWNNWTSARKAKEGEITTDIFGFLTCDPNSEVSRVHPKAMPVILTTAEEYHTWPRPLVSGRAQRRRTAILALAPRHSSDDSPCQTSSTCRPSQKTATSMSLSRRRAAAAL